jgi:hypothetical protein
LEASQQFSDQHLVHISHLNMPTTYPAHPILLNLITPTTLWYGKQFYLHFCIGVKYGLLLRQRHKLLLVCGNKLQSKVTNLTGVCGSYSC